MDLIQSELHSVALEWNVHRIRPSTNLESPSGKPDVLYFLPTFLGVQDYCTPVHLEEIEIAEDMCAVQRQAKGCCPSFKALAEMIMEDERLQTPSTADKARQLYLALLDLIDDL